MELVEFYRVRRSLTWYAAIVLGITLIAVLFVHAPSVIISIGEHALTGVPLSNLMLVVMLFTAALASWIGLSLNLRTQRSSLRGRVPSSNGARRALPCDRSRCARDRLPSRRRRGARSSCSWATDGLRSMRMPPRSSSRSASSRCGTRCCRC